METNYLVQDLTTIVVIASGVSILFSILRWPSILGYLLSGLIVGPYLTSGFSVHDQGSIRNISELGVIFLMFCIGLEFDLKKLKQTLFPSFLAMLFQALMAFTVGTATAHIAGWNATIGIFLGAIFSISSTMVAIPLIKQQNAMQQPFAQFTMGVAILEDIFAVVLLVILSNLRQNGFHFTKCFHLVFWITVFIASMLIFGRLAAQRFIRLLGKISSNELAHVCIVGLILLLSELSSSYSNALGAFLAGAIFSNTDIIHHLETMIAPIRDVFTAVFFVSIGMLIDPHLLWVNKWIILLLTVIIVIGQFCSAWFGFFLSGQKPIVAFRASLPKSQIGEFSFVIAALAQTIGLDHGQLMAITVGIALASIIAVSVLCKYENGLIQLSSKIIPTVLKSCGNVYQNILSSAQTYFSTNHFLNAIREPLLKIVIHFFLANAIIWCNYGLCRYLEQNPIPSLVPYTIWIQRTLLLIALALALPFMSAMVRNLNLIITTLFKQTLRRFYTRLSNHAALARLFQLFIIAIATFVFVWIFLLSASQYLPTYIPYVALIVIGLIIGFGFWKNLRNLNSHFELMFLKSFSEELENENEHRRQAMIKMLENKHPWKIHTKQITLTKHSHLIGISLAESQFSNQTNTLLLGIERGGVFCDFIPATHVFYPGDTLLLLGDEQQLTNATQWIAQPMTTELHTSNDFDLDQLILTDNHPLIHETIASANLRQRFSVHIVGIQRKDQRLTKLEPTDIFKPGDCVLLVGHRKNLDAIKQLSNAKDPAQNTRSVL